MTPATLFSIGAVVFMIGGLGLVLLLLDTFQDWRIREKQADEDTYLDDETIGQAMGDPRHKRH